MRAGTIYLRVARGGMGGGGGLRPTRRLPPRRHHLSPLFSPPHPRRSSYDQLSANHTIVHWLRTRFQRVFGISLPLPLNVIPRKCKVTTVIGPAIPVEQNSYPTCVCKWRADGPPPSLFAVRGLTALLFECVPMW